MGLWGGEEQVFAGSKKYVSEQVISAKYFYNSSKQFGYDTEIVMVAYNVIKQQWMLNVHLEPFSKDKVHQKIKFNMEI